MSKFGKLIYDLQEISDYHADYNASLLDFACQPPDQHKHAEEVIDKVVNILIVAGKLEVVTEDKICRDEADKVVYTEMVPESGQEPDYDKALAAL